MPEQFGPEDSFDEDHGCEDFTKDNGCGPADHDRDMGRAIDRLHTALEAISEIAGANELACSKGAPHIAAVKLHAACGSFQTIALLAEQAGIAIVELERIREALSPREFIN